MALLISYRTQVMAADILIYAGTIVDRYLSSRWKTFFDRSFFNTHTPKLIGKQMAFVISGPYSQLPNLNEILNGIHRISDGARGWSCE